MKKSFQLGWIFAAAFAAVWTTTAMQSTPDKFAVVSVNKLISDSGPAKATRASIDAFTKPRKDLIQFLVDNPVATFEQMQNLREVMLRTKRSQEEELKLQTLQNAIKESSKKFTTLSGLPTPTADEKTLYNELSDRRNKCLANLQGWQSTFQSEIQEFGDGEQDKLTQKIREATANVAKAQGVTLVYDRQFAIYGAIDITDATLAAMGTQ
jgi:Skp family chaperone for outer membrane proteins